MPKKGTISVRGDIGKYSYTDKAGQTKEVNGMQLVDLMAQVAKFGPDLEHLTVEVEGPGGAVPVAKAMRGYLKQMQPRIKVTTRQTGPIYSAHSIIFSSGSERLALKGVDPATGKEVKIGVHNPWLTSTSGNADQLTAQAEDLRETEQEFVAMYGEDTGMKPEALVPLMKADSEFNADQAVALGFATGSYTKLQQAALHQTNQPTMDNNQAPSQNSVLDALLVAIGLKKPETNGTKVAAAPPAELMGKPVTVDGKPAVDGIYTVVGGVVTALAAATPEQSAAAPGTQAAPGQAAPASAAATPASGLTEAQVLALIEKSKAPGAQAAPAAAPAAALTQEQAIAKLGEAIATAVTGLKATQKTTHVPVGFKPENKVTLAAEWDKLFKENKTLALKKEDPEKFQLLFFSKYGKMPNM